MIAVLKTICSTTLQEQGVKKHFFKVSKFNLLKRTVTATRGRILIEEIEIKKKYKSLTRFHWKNIPKFVLLAGQNGSGKTQILNLLSIISSKKNNTLNISDFRIEGQIKENIIYIPVNYGFSNLTNNRGSAGYIDNWNSGFVSYCRGEKRDNTKYNQIIKEIELKSGSKVSELEDKDLIEAIPTDYSIRLSEDLNNQHITETFKNYQKKRDLIALNSMERENVKPTKEDIISKIGHPPPWDTINKLFSKYNFDLKISFPERGINYIPLFTKSNGSKIQFNDLSSGEKVIVSLIIWSYNNLIGANKNIFLFDELDAHLHPSMKKMYTHLT